jgi:hypothetical protein
MEIGTEILLKRIKDCPEEFADHDIHGIGRWSRVLNAARECLPREEADAINKAMEEARRQHMLDRFNEQVLKTLAGENTEDKQQPYIVPSSMLKNVATSLGAMSGATGGVISSSSQQYGQGWTDPRGQQEMMQAQKEMMHKQYAASQATAEVYARYTAHEKARNVGFFSKLGRKLFNA